VHDILAASPGPHFAKGIVDAILGFLGFICGGGIFIIGTLWLINWRLRNKERQTSGRGMVASGETIPSIRRNMPSQEFRPMRLLTAFALLGGLALLAGIDINGQNNDSPKTKNDPPKKKIAFPPGWDTLNLSAEQKFRFYQAHASRKEQVVAIEEKVKKLEAEMNATPMLTAEQKKAFEERIAKEKSKISELEDAYQKELNGLLTSEQTKKLEEWAAKQKKNPKK
jgi:hypothetical protein